MTKSDTGIASPTATAVRGPDANALSLGELTTALAEHRLLHSDELTDLKEEVRTNPTVSARELCGRLVSDGLLTKWQVARLMERKGGFWLGRYQLRERIGSGGMSVVMKARKNGTAPDVAIKILAKTLLKKRNARKRFEREIQAAGALTHQNIVRALDADIIDDVPCLVMEYVNGRTVSSLITKRGPLPIAWCCEFARQAADGLAVAHDLGLIHRDIKPSNLLLRKRTDTRAEREGNAWEVKILDFGLARLLSESSEETDLTGANQVFGTVDYIAPEQARRARTADERADIYSLGCTLFYMLTGRVPFVGENVMEKLAARLAEDPPSARQFRAEIPPALDGLVLRMLAKEREQRFQSAREVSDALAAFATGQPIDVPSPALQMSDGEIELDPPSTTVPSDGDSVLALEGFLSHMDDRQAFGEDSRSDFRRSRWPAWGTWAIALATAVALLLITWALWKKQKDEGSSSFRAPLPITEPLRIARHIPAPIDRSLS